MLNSSLSPKDPCTMQNQHLVMVLHEERSAMWSMYCKIAEMRPYFDHSEKVRPLLCRFSQLLIDYVSLGHFGVYEHLLTGKQQPAAILSYAHKLYPAFSNTTANVIIFNDAYDDCKHNFNTANLAKDLSILGENLAARMELEDKLCSMLLH